MAVGMADGGVVVLDLQNEAVHSLEGSVYALRTDLHTVKVLNLVSAETRILRWV